MPNTSNNLSFIAMVLLHKDPSDHFFDRPLKRLYTIQSHAPPCLRAYGK